MAAFDDPLAWMMRLLADAHESHPHDASRAALATANAEGRPSVRYVLVKSITERGLVFFTHRNSQKGRELAENPWAALAFHWWDTGYQVRARGRTEEISTEESDAYFASRPRGSQIGAWASTQSEPIRDRGALLTRFRQQESRFENQSIPRPPDWGGYRLVPDEVEVWKDGEFRLHDRHLYRRRGNQWERTRLMP